MYSTITSPPMPEWSGLSNDDRAKIVDAWQMAYRPQGADGAFVIYEAIRLILQAREQRLFEITQMAQGID